MNPINFCRFYRHVSRATPVKPLIPYNPNTAQVQPRETLLEKRVREAREAGVCYPLGDSLSPQDETAAQKLLGVLDKHEKKMQRKTVARHTKYLEGNAAENFMRQIAEEGEKMEQEMRATSPGPTRPAYAAGAGTGAQPAGEVGYRISGNILTVQKKPPFATSGFKRMH